MIIKSEAIKAMEQKIGLDMNDIPRLIEVFPLSEDEGTSLVSDMSLHPVPIFLLRRLFPEWKTGEFFDEPLFGCYTITPNVMKHLYPYLSSKKVIFNFLKYEYVFSVAYAEDCQEYRNKKLNSFQEPGKLYLALETLKEMEEHLNSKHNKFQRWIMAFSKEKENFFLVDDTYTRPVPVELLQEIFPEWQDEEYPDELLIACYSLTPEKISYLAPYIVNTLWHFDFEKYDYVITIAPMEVIENYIKQKQR